MARVALEAVTKVFGRHVPAVRDVSLEIESGEVMALVGPSGCGKSTILRLIAGLETPTAGEIWIGDRLVTDLPPGLRDIAMVFQSAAMLPHRTVAQNMGFGLQLRRRPRAEIKRQVVQVAATLGVDHLLDRKPDELSGGERQRVAIGRAMLRDPQAFLMDEPLSSLDAQIRPQLRGELARLHRRLGTTVVYVTHDQSEAMTLGHRIAVLREGALEQVDTPERVFTCPANTFVACFFGSPTMNMLPAVIDRRELVFEGGRLPLPSSLAWTSSSRKSVTLGLRPTDLEDADWAPERGLPVLEGVVEAIEQIGSAIDVMFTFSGSSPGARDLLTARVDRRSRARPGGVVRLVIGPDCLYVFDRMTGRSLYTPGPPQ